MKKIITPIIHLAFLFPLTIIAMGSIEFIARTFDLLPDYILVFRMPYIFLIIGIILISSTLLFWLANGLMQLLEKLKTPTIYDYIRQSIFYYFIIFYILLNWISSGFAGNEDDVYFLTGLCISIVSIVINIIFKRKTTIE